MGKKRNHFEIKLSANALKIQQTYVNLWKWRTNKLNH